MDDTFINYKFVVDFPIAYGIASCSFVFTNTSKIVWDEIFPYSCKYYLGTYIKHILVLSKELTNAWQVSPQCMMVFHINGVLQNLRLFVLFWCIFFSLQEFEPAKQEYFMKLCIIIIFSDEWNFLIRSWSILSI